MEDLAYNYLQSYYSTRFNSPTYTFKDEKTKKGQFIDGLLALKEKDGAVFTASFQASGTENVARILKKYKKQGVSKWRFLSATLSATLVAALVFKVMAAGLVYVIPATFIVLVASFTGHTILEKRFLKAQVLKSVETLKEMPANNLWLGITISSLVFRNNALATTLVEACKASGIGLITVGKRSKVVLHTKPDSSKKYYRDYLVHYASEATIRKVLDSDTAMKVA